MIRKMNVLEEFRGSWQFPPGQGIDCIQTRSRSVKNAADTRAVKYTAQVPAFFKGLHTIYSLSGLLYEKGLNC